MFKLYYAGSLFLWIRKIIRTKNIFLSQMNFKETVKSEIKLKYASRYFSGLNVEANKRWSGCHSK